MSPAAAQETQLLEQEQRVGARYPEVRSGLAGQSQLTGRGVQELLGGFDTQIKSAQTVLASALRRVYSMAFEMDEKFWPDTTKTIRGVAQNAPFNLTYRPSKDIKGDHTIHVRYGLAAGMDPNRFVVMMLQLRQDSLVSREFLQRELPFEVDSIEMQRQVDVEQTRDALKNVVGGVAQAVTQMLMQGADPSHLISQFSDLVGDLQRGDPYEVAAAKAFKPQEQPQTAPAGLNGPPSGPGVPMPPGPPSGPPGAPPGVGGAPMGSPAGAAPQGGPPTDLASILARIQGKGKGR
jgi:hypothetical protein